MPHFGRVVACVLLLSAVMMGGCSNPHRATLANPGLDQQPMRGVFYFPGNWERDPTATRLTAEFYGRYPWLGGNESKYTLHPAQAYHLGFSESAAARTQAVADIAATHANVIVMSYWGPRLTDNWMFWAPMQDAPKAHEELFDAVLGQNLVIMPSIEDSWPTMCSGGISPGFRLADEFPNGVERVIDGRPVSPLLRWVMDLVTRFITHPQNAEWPVHFARMYDRAGTRRYVINLKDVSSTQTQPLVTDQSFADGFVRLAHAVKTMTGVDVGFTIDPLETMQIPDPTKPDPCKQVAAKTTYIPSTPQARAALASLNEVVAVQAYRSEITQTGGGNNQYERMIAHKRQFLADWLSAGMPVIADVSAGYDGHIIFKDAIHTYGHSDEWRNDQSQLRSGHITGLMFTAWNGYTEGWAGMPTLENGTDGTDPGAMTRWLQAVFTPDPRDCNHVHFANGQPLFVVYGAICEKYYKMNGTRGALGAPLSSEHAGNVSGVRRTDFEHGSILWKGGPEAFEVHGLIGEQYKQMGYESAGRLGVPTSDEQDFSGCPHGELGRYNQFERGRLVWCSQSTPEVEIYP
jgi:hypothetical protein